MTVRRLLCACALGAAACSSSSNASTTTPDSCGFVQNKSNCWVQELASIDGCLGEPPEAGTPAGTLSADGRTCTYVDGRVDTFVDPLGDLSNEPAQYDLTLRKNGVVCAHVTRGGDGSFAMSGPTGGAAKITKSADALTFTCADGSPGFVGDDRSPCAVAAPGSTITISLGGSELEVLLAGMKNPLFACHR